MNRIRVMFPLLITLAAIVTACGGGSEEAAAPQNTTIDVVAHDLYFGEDADNINNPPVWTAPAGSVATINFENMGSLEHNWAVIKQGEEVPVPFVMEDNDDAILFDTGAVQPGEMTTVPFRVPNEPGEYIVICTISGHYPTMQGRLVIS